MYSGVNPYDNLSSFGEGDFFMLALWTKYGKSVILPAILILIASFYFYLQSTNNESPDTVQLLTASEPQLETTEQPAQLEEPPIETIIVDVKGAVLHPGVYSFTTENRIIDAIQAAGGYTKVADTRLINHAQKLSDELVIYVPQIGEEPEQMASIAASINNSATSSSSSNSANSDVVNINSASENELTTLPGIGPSKAAAIIAYREENGQFQTVDDLKNVSGIGDKTFERLQPLIAVK